MKDTNWLIIDTETTGLYRPISAVEIAGQRMRGWQREGKPFRVLLNHDVPIEPQAQAVHGYSRAFLRENGLPPVEAHRLFRDYVGDLPIVAHNLSFDWDRVLVPEWLRLGLPQAGRRGFCAMTLARRLVGETSRHGLEPLVSRFCPRKTVKHNAHSDTQLVVDLFETVYGPRLLRAGISTFDSVSRFSRRTPITECRNLVLAAKCQA